MTVTPPGSLSSPGWLPCLPATFTTFPSLLNLNKQWLPPSATYKLSSLSADMPVGCFITVLRFCSCFPCLLNALTPTVYSVTNTSCWLLNAIPQGYLIFSITITVFPNSVCGMFANTLKGLPGTGQLFTASVRWCQPRTLGVSASPRGGTSLKRHHRLSPPLAVAGQVACGSLLDMSQLRRAVRHRRGEGEDTGWRGRERAERRGEWGREKRWEGGWQRVDTDSKFYVSRCTQASFQLLI